MKHLTLTRERNRRLTEALRKKMAEERLHKVTEAVIQEVLHTPVERGFFVSVDHIIVMERRRREGTLPKMSELHGKMWTEIFAIFDNYREARPESTLTEAAIHVASRTRASRFYVSNATAKRILK